ncbi:hypothetical protein GUITHDRAFT_147046 [Guillardia theta CCMP2712]|uniref:Uncharacterized protein n=1 Tax=Guillardia theta (strain CCMP2712) TaxID=905079 RepID=L1IFJ2_GUITC|nr:hypothetical protein GUITHDRAFT_147046 [Guillardia theta CCMP2712]EKX34620.1 hypothetical protein GUITHDRAFT_147046 [Guillardia theta CCMP2712]|eukprot:XP_005821600.1 hypothetical protein GUITHDRAFT_147046 [Guillardia theta CCMP2712]
MRYNQLSAEEKHSMIKVHEWLKAEKQYSDAKSNPEQEKTTSQSHEEQDDEENLASHRPNIKDTVSEQTKPKRHIKKSDSRRRNPMLHLDETEQQSIAAPSFESLTMSPQEHVDSESSLSSLLNFPFSWGSNSFRNSEDKHNMYSADHRASSMDLQGILDSAFVELLGSKTDKLQKEDKSATAEEFHDNKNEKPAMTHDWEDKAIIASWRARCLSSHDTKEDLTTGHNVYVF